MTETDHKTSALKMGTGRNDQTMNTVWKRICGLTLAVLLVLTNLPAQTAFAGRAEAIDVQSSEELEAALNGGAEFIRIKADFALDRTFYVSGNTVLFADEAHTLTRAADFGGDLFVVGVSAEGTAATAPVTMELGTENGAGLVLDGSKAGLSEDLTVTGTALYVTGNAAVTIHDDVIFRNFRKDGNARTIEEELGSAADVGGAAVIVSSGSVTIEGAEVPLWILDSAVREDALMCPPMTECLCAVDGGLYVLFESAAKTYMNPSKPSVHPMDRVFQLKDF